MTYQEALKRAREESITHACDQHVEAILDTTGDEPRISHYRISDWFGDATVASFNNGRDF